MHRLPYFFQKLQTRPTSFHNYGYYIWYWHVDRNPWKCPLQPLTPEFCRDKLGAVLIYGIILPTDIPTGNILILVTQSLSYVRSKGLRNLSTQHKQKLFETIVHLDFLGVNAFRSEILHQDLAYFQRYEEVFNLHILPRKDEDGEYYRALIISCEDRILRPNAEDKFGCPKCGQLVSLTKGLWVRDNLYEENGAVIIRAICQHCNGVTSLTIEVPIRYRCS